MTTKRDRGEVTWGFTQVAIMLKSTPEGVKP